MSRVGTTPHRRTASASIPTTSTAWGPPPTTPNEAFWAIVHSHVRTPAAPSPTDIEMAAWWPSLLQVLVSLDPAEADPATGTPSLRAWRIVDAAVFEVAVEPA